jgi:DNA modification methylase
MDAESVHCCVTSPPYYGLRDYGVEGQIGMEATPDAYVAELVAVFREVRRVLRDDGTLWLNLGDSYTGSANAGSERTRTCNSKPNATDRNLPAKRGAGLKPKDLIGIPWRVAFALQADGWYLRSDIIWAKRNPMPESVTDRPTKAHEYVFLLTKSARYWYDAEAVAEKQTSDGPRVDKEHLNNQYGYAVNRLDAGVYHGRCGQKGDGTRNRRSVWTIPTQRCSEAHFAVMPPELIKPCILAGCPYGGVVLDPFGGSGTTGRVAEDLGRDSILIELNPKYIEIARRRAAQQGLL